MRDKIAWNLSTIWLELQKSIMDEFSHDLNPVQHIIADAFGEPGQRTFFLQGRCGRELLSVVLEKQEVANLAISILQIA